MEKKKLNSYLSKFEAITDASQNVHRIIIGAETIGLIKLTVEINDFGKASDSLILSDYLIDEVVQYCEDFTEYYVNKKEDLEKLRDK